MLLKVLVDKHDFLPMLKTDGEFYMAPKTLHKGESLEVKDFIGYALMAEYKGAFEVIQEDPIKDAVDNTVKLEDVKPELKAQRKRQTKQIQADQLTRHDAALKTAGDYSDGAKDRIEDAKGEETGDKLALNKKKQDQDAADAAKKHQEQVRADALAKAAVANVNAGGTSNASAMAAAPIQAK